MTRENQTVGLIGIGLLGSAIAQRLLSAGFSVVGFDASLERRAALAVLRGTPVDSARDVAAQCRRIVLCLPDSEVVLNVTDQLLSHLQPGDVLIDTTTGDPTVTRDLSQRFAQHDVHVVDATVLGSSETMRDGEALLMVGGLDAVVVSCRDLLQVISRKSHHIGPSGSGQMMKLVANLVLGLNRAALAEGLHLAKANGLDLAAVLRILKSGAAYSRAMDAKGEKMISGDFTPQARLSQHLKDVRLILQAADQSGVKLPLSTSHRDLLETAEALGLGQLDNSAIFRAFGSSLLQNP